MRDPNLYLIFGTTLFAVMGVASIAPAFPLMMEYFGLDKPHVGLLVSVCKVRLSKPWV